MLIHLNIDVWKDKKNKDIYVKEPPTEVDAELIVAGTAIEHKLKSPFIKRIKDLKIIFDSSCLPPLDRSGEDWKWQGYSNR
jgi:hypothetical protein